MKQESSFNWRMHKRGAQLVSKATAAGIVAVVLYIVSYCFVVSRTPWRTSESLLDDGTVHRPTYIALTISAFVFLAVFYYMSRRKLANLAATFKRAEAQPKVKSASDREMTSMDAAVQFIVRRHMYMIAAAWFAVASVLRVFDKSWLFTTLWPMMLFVVYMCAHARLFSNAVAREKAPSHFLIWSRRVKIAAVSVAVVSGFVFTMISAINGPTGTLISQPPLAVCQYISAAAIFVYALTVSIDMQLDKIGGDAPTKLNEAAAQMASTTAGSVP